MRTFPVSLSYFFFWAWIFAWAHCWKQLFTSVNWLISQNWLQFLFNIFLVKVVAFCLIVKSLCLIELGFFLKIKIYINSKFKVLKSFVSYSVSIYVRNFSCNVFYIISHHWNPLIYIVHDTSSATWWWYIKKNTNG